MPRVDVPRFVVGDEVSDGPRTGVIVESFPRKSDGRRFLMVRLTAPGCQGKQVWPSQGYWEPQIHWQATGATERCVDCEREFRGGVDEFGLRRIFCRTCDRIRELSEQRAAQDAGPSHQFGMRVNRARRRE